MNTEKEMTEFIKVEDYQEADDNLSLVSIKINKFRGCLFVWSKDFEDWYDNEDHGRLLKDWLLHRYRVSIHLYDYKRE